MCVWLFVLFYLSILTPIDNIGFFPYLDFHSRLDFPTFPTLALSAETGSKWPFKRSGQPWRFKFIFVLSLTPWTLISFFPKQPAVWSTSKPPWWDWTKMNIILMSVETAKGRQQRADPSWYGSWLTEDQPVHRKIFSISGSTDKSQPTAGHTAWSGRYTIVYYGKDRTWVTSPFQGHWSQALDNSYLRTLTRLDRHIKMGAVIGLASDFLPDVRPLKARCSMWRVFACVGVSLCLSLCRSPYVLGCKYIYVGVS